MKEEHNAVSVNQVTFFGQQFQMIHGLIQLNVHRDRLLDDVKAQLPAYVL